MGDPEDALFAAMAMRDLAAERAGAPGRQPRPGAPGEGPERPDEHHRRRHQRRAARDELLAPGTAAGLALVLRSGVLPVARLRQPVPPRRLAHRQARARARGLRGGRRDARRPSASTRSRRARRPTRPARSAGSRARARSACGAPRCSPRRSLFLLIIAGGVGARAVMPEPVVAKPAPAKPVVEAPGDPGGSRRWPHPLAAAPQRRKSSVRRSSSRGSKRTPRARRWKSRPPRRRRARAAWRSRLRRGATFWSTARSAAARPPLLVIDVPAGAHTIEIRNATSPAHTARVEVKPGETIRIQHRFR